MRTFAAFDAKTHFSKLLDLVEAGEEVRITRHGKPVARLVAESGKSTSHESVKLFLAEAARVRSQAMGGDAIVDLVRESRKY